MGSCGHLCLRGDVLAAWDQLPASPLEDLERLEQLRLIEAGLTINTFQVEGNLFSVDTAEQLVMARQMVLEQSHEIIASTAQSRCSLMQVVNKTIGSYPPGGFVGPEVSVIAGRLYLYLGSSLITYPYQRPGCPV